jgi:hypothetical protein
LETHEVNAGDSEHIQRSLAHISALLSKTLWIDFSHFGTFWSR